MQHEFTSILFYMGVSIIMRAVCSYNVKNHKTPDIWVTRGHFWNGGIFITFALLVAAITASAMRSIV